MQSCEKRFDVGAPIDPMVELVNASDEKFLKDIQNNNITISPSSSTCTNTTLTGSDSASTFSSIRTFRAVPSLCESHVLNNRRKSDSFCDKQGDSSDIDNVERVNASFSEILLAEMSNETAKSVSDVTIKAECHDNIFATNNENHFDAKALNDGNINQYETMKYELLAELINKVFTSNCNEEHFKVNFKLAKTRSKSSIKKMPCLEDHVNIIEKDNNIEETPVATRILAFNNGNIFNINKNVSNKFNTENMAPSVNETIVTEVNRVKKQISNYETHIFGTVPPKKKTTINKTKSVSNTHLQPEVIYYKGSKYSLQDKKPSEKFSFKGIKKYSPQGKIQSNKTKSGGKLNQNIIHCDKVNEPIRIKEMNNDLFVEPACLQNLFCTSRVLRKPSTKDVLVNTSDETGNLSGSFQSCSSYESDDPCSIENCTNKFEPERMLPFKNEILNVAIALGYNQHDYFQKYKNISENEKRVLIPHCSSAFMDVLMDIVPSFEIAKEDLNYQSGRSEINLVIPDGSQCENVCSSQNKIDNLSQVKSKPNYIFSNETGTNNKETIICTNNSVPTTSLDSKRLEISGDSIVRNTKDVPTQNILRKEYSIPNDEIMKNILNHINLTKDKQQLLEEFNTPPIRNPDLWDRLNNILETTVMRLEVSISEKIISEMKKLMTDSPQFEYVTHSKGEKLEETLIQIGPDEKHSCNDLKYKTEHNVNFIEDLASADKSDVSKLFKDVSLQCALIYKKESDDLILKTHLGDPPDIMLGTSKHYMHKLSKPSLLKTCVNMIKLTSLTDDSIEVEKNNVAEEVKLTIDKPGTEEIAGYHSVDLLGKTAIFIRENIMVLSSIPIFILAMAVLYLFILLTRIP